MCRDFFSQTFCFFHKIVWATKGKHSCKCFQKLDAPGRQQQEVLSWIFCHRLPPEATAPKHKHAYSHFNIVHLIFHTNKQQILGFDFLIQLTFKFQPGLGPVRIQGRGGQTMLNGILAFSILGFHLLSRLHPPYCLTSLKQSEESAPTSKTLYCAGLDFNILQLLISAVWYNTSSRQCTTIIIIDLVVYL